MAEKHFVVVIDGVRQAMSSSQFESHFGHIPTRPEGEAHHASGSNYTFGGRYENATWDSDSQTPLTSNTYQVVYGGLNLKLVTK